MGDELNETSQPQTAQSASEPRPTPPADVSRLKDARILSVIAFAFFVLGTIAALSSSKFNVNDLHGPNPLYALAVTAYVACAVLTIWAATRGYPFFLKWWNDPLRPPG